MIRRIVDVKSIMELDEKLHSDYLPVSKKYAEKFVSDHFKQLLCGYNNFDQQ